jgi:anti-sigma factor RsiW
MPQADQSFPSEWDKLNAFADGELAPAEQRALAARLATSPEAAETLRGIVRLKQELQGLPAGDAPPLPSFPAASRPVWRRVAAIAAVLVIAATVALTPVLLRQDASESFLAASLAAHEQFAIVPPQPTATVAPAAAGPVTSELARLGLQPVWQVTSATGQIRVGFIGLRGCRLSLHVSPHVEPTPPSDQSARTLAGWNAGGHGYLLIASEMPPARFEIIADFLKALTSGPADKVAPLRTALLNDWRSAQPCLA